MFYVIKNNGVISSKTLKGINVKLNSKFDIDEFTVVGPDMVLKLNQSDFEFVQDKKKMENLCFAGFFKKDNSVKLLCFFNLAITFVNLILNGSCNSLLKQLVSYFGGK